MSRRIVLLAVLVPFALARSASAEAPDRPLAPLDASPRAITDLASEKLLASALAARAKGDGEETTRALRGWASLGARDHDVPKALAASAAEAIAWVKERGAFGVFASRRADRVSVGVNDPASLLLRVDAWVDDRGELRRINRGEDRDVDRRDYPFAEAELRAATVVIDAVGRVAGEDVLLARVVLRPEALLPPPPPDPTKAALRRVARPETATRAEPQPLVPWWWVAAGTVALGLVGAGVWQELGR